MNSITVAGLRAALGLSLGASSRLINRPDFPAPIAAESNGGRPEKRWRIPDLPETLTIKGRALAIRAPAQAWALHQAIAVPPAPTSTNLLAPAPSAAGALPAVAQSAAGLSLPQSSADLTDAQRLRADARKGVLAELARLRAQAGCSQEAAMHSLLTLAASGQASPFIVRALQLARDGRGKKGKNDLPSVRTLKRWLKAPDLAPKVVQKDMSVPPWAKDFLSHYQQPQKPSVEAAYRAACNDWAAGETPSIHQVRHFLDKLGTVTRERGRMGPRELKNIQPFIRRDFSHLEPNDIWTADGHCFDAEVQHPLHGRPFRPEITAILDIATRRCVGWSLDLAESGTAVADAIRYAVERCGIPAIFYVDNGGGYQNKMMKDKDTGLMSRLGIDMRHSIAYNSQARGVIERAHQTIFVQAAKQLPSYIGAEMDREARLQQFKLTRQALKKGAGQTRAMPLIPFDVFLQFIEGRVADYNAKAHRTLKGTSPDLAWRAFEARGWQAHTLTAADTETLFRPRVSRIIQRAEINLFTNIYFARELAEFHGIKAQIAYDIHDASRIWVYTPEGRFICEAQANGNRRRYMPVPVVRQACEKRAKGRLARDDARRDGIREELHGAPALAVPEGHIVLGTRIVATEIAQAEGRALLERDARPASPARPARRSERSVAENMAEWDALDARILAGEHVDEDQAYWHESFQRHPSWRAEMKRREDEGGAEGRRAAV